MLTRRRTDADAVLLVCTLLADPLFWTQLATEGRMPAESASHAAAGLLSPLAMSTDCLLRGVA